GDPSVPGKFFEYVGSRRPVLVCAPASFEMRRLAESTKTGIGAWTTPEIVTALKTIENLEIQSADRASFTRARSAARMLEVFEQTVKARPSRRVQESAIVNV